MVEWGGGWRRLDGGMGGGVWSWRWNGEEGGGLQEGLDDGMGRRVEDWMIELHVH